MRAKVREGLEGLFWRPRTVPVLFLMGAFVIGPLVVFRSVLAPIFLVLYLWPWLLGMALNLLWVAPAMTDFLNEIEYANPGYIDGLTPLRLSVRKASSPEAERLRGRLNRRQRTTTLVFVSVVPWICFVVLIRGLVA